MRNAHRQLQSTMMEPIRHARAVGNPEPGRTHFTVMNDARAMHKGLHLSDYLSIIADKADGDCLRDARSERIERRVTCGHNGKRSI